MRTVLAWLSLFYLVAGQAPLAIGQVRIVDLDGPGALEVLARENPAHYQRVRKAIAELLAHPYSNAPRGMQSGYNRDSPVEPPGLLLTTAPPKRRLSLAIDDVRYEGFVTISVDAALQHAALFEAEGSSEAVKAYRGAANLGSSEAANRLAEIYDKGLLGVPRDLGEAQKWRNAAKVRRR